jgi:hypothetical protein
MSRFDLLKGVRDLDAALDDYRPKKWRGNQFESSTYEEPIGGDVDGDNIERSGMSGFHAAPFPPPIKSGSFNQHGHRNELGHSRLDEIAKAIRALTYAEMLELAESMWKVNSHGSEIAEADLPSVWHRWSASQR